MFNKKNCKKCGEKISGKFSFCPNCGNYLESNKEDWGMLGKDDSIPEENFPQNNLFGGISGKMFNKMLGGAMKMLEKELQKEIRQPTKNNFELYINGKKIPTENIKVTRKPTITKKNVQEQSVSSTHFNKDSLKKFSELPKKEPSTNIRRLSNKVIYEMEIPGVKSIQDVSIVKLEKSIEIKALAKDKAYKKLIPIDLPLNKYSLNGQKLVLELGVKN